MIRTSTVRVFNEKNKQFRLSALRLFHDSKSEIERFTAAGWRFRQNLKKFEKLRRCLTDYVKKSLSFVIFLRWSFDPR